MTSAVTGTSELSARVRTLVAIALVFSLGVPMLGCMVTWLNYGLWEGGLAYALEFTGSVLLVPIIFAGPAFIFGILPALLAGFFVGIRNAFFVPATWRDALTISFFNGLLVFTLARLAGVTAMFDLSPPESKVPPNLALCFAMASGAFAATFVCWLCVRSWCPKRQADFGVPPDELPAPPH